MNETFVVRDLYPVLPEIMLAVGRDGRCSWSARSAASAPPPPSTGSSILLLIAAGAVIAWLPAERLEAFGGSFVLEPYARFLKLLALIGSATAILMSLDYFEREQQNRFEYPILILLSTAGMLMLISAADLIALYLGLELMCLVALRRRRDQPRFRALDRGRASNISCSARCRRECCSTAPRWSTASPAP